MRHIGAFDLPALTCYIVRQSCGRRRRAASRVRRVTVTAWIATTARPSFEILDRSPLRETTLFTPRHRRPSACRRHVEIIQLPAAALLCCCSWQLLLLVLLRSLGDVHYATPTIDVCLTPCIDCSAASRARVAGGQTSIALRSDFICGLSSSKSKQPSCRYPFQLHLHFSMEKKKQTVL